MDEDTIKKLNEATAAVLETRDRIDKLEAEHKGTGELRAKVDKIADDLVTAEKAVQLQDATAKRVDEIETRFASLKEIQEESKVRPAEHRDAIRDFIRTRGGQLSPMEKYDKFMGSGSVPGILRQLLCLEQHTITEGTYADGGIFVDPEMDKEILKNYVAIDPIRSVADVRSISTMEIKGYRRVGTPTAYHGTELANGTYSNATWADYKIPVYPLYVDTRVSEDMLSDVRYVESEIASDAGEAFGYTEGVDFLEGTGVDRAQGVMYGHGTDSAKYMADVTGTGTQAIAADDIATMYTTLLVPYRANSTWAMNSDSLKRVLLLKESTTNAYIWQPGLQAGPPTMIYGRPYIICESLDNQADDAYPIILADFKRLYRIADRSGIVLLRDVYTAYPAVNFRMRKRVGGQVIKPEAGKVLKTT